MKKQIKIILIAAIFLIIFAAGFCWFINTHIRINGDIFSVSATEVVLKGEVLPDLELLKQMEKMETLDVRNIPLQPEQYEQLRSALPGCRILWQVPVFDGAFDNTETELVMAAVTGRDVENLEFFPNLKTVNATLCTDYEMLMVLQKTDGIYGASCAFGRLTIP